MEALGRVQKSNEDLAALLRRLPRGKSTNTSMVADCSTPTIKDTRHSIEYYERSASAASELPVIKLQLENMQLNLQSAHEEIKFVRIKCEKSQGDLVDAQMEAVRSKRQLDLLSKQHSELQVLASRADGRVNEVEDELKTHGSNFESTYNTRSCLGIWISATRRRHLVDNFMVDASVRRSCRTKRITLFSWFRKAAARTADKLKTQEESVSGSEDLRYALGIITHRMSVSPRALPSLESSPVQLQSKLSQPSIPPSHESPKELELAAANALLAHSLSMGLSAISDMPDQAKYPRNSAPAPLNTLQRLKNAYRPAKPAGNSAAPSLRCSPVQETSPQSLESTNDHKGPLAWFLKEYDHAIKGSRDYHAKPHAPFDYSSGRVEHGLVGDQITSNSLMKSKRFLKLNGLEVGTKVNPHQNIVVEAELGVHLTNSPGLGARGRSRSPDPRDSSTHRWREPRRERGLQEQLDRERERNWATRRTKEREDQENRNGHMLDSRYGPERKDSGWDMSQEWGWRPGAHEFTMSTPQNRSPQRVAPVSQGFQFSSTSPLLPTSRPAIGVDKDSCEPFQFDGGSAGVAAGSHQTLMAHRSSQSNKYLQQQVHGSRSLMRVGADTDAEEDSLHTPFLSDTAVQHWTPDKAKGEHTRKQKVAHGNTTTDAGDPATPDTVHPFRSNTPSNGPRGYAQGHALRYGGVPLSPALQQQQEMSSQQKETKGIFPSQVKQNYSLVTTNEAAQQNSDITLLASATQQVQDQDQDKKHRVDLPPKTTWEKIEQEKVQHEGETALNTAKESEPEAARMIKRGSSCSQLLVPQAQWARQQLGQKLDLESPRLLESPRGAGVGASRKAILQRVPWAQT